MVWQTRDLTQCKEYKCILEWEEWSSLTVDEFPLWGEISPFLFPPCFLSRGRAVMVKQIKP